MEIALLGVYGLFIFCSAFSTRQRTMDSFFVNNRQSGALSVGLSIVVSCVGASATIGMIGMAFNAGTPAFWWLGAGGAGLVLLSLVLARRIRESGAYTLPHLVETSLGPTARLSISGIIVVAWCAILAAQFAALARVLEPLTGFSPPACLGIGLALVCGHTLGGQSAIMRVDRIQAVVILLALITILGWLTWRNPTWPIGVEIRAVNTDFPPSTLLYFLLVVGANYVVCPMLFGRMLSARDRQSARLGGLIGAGGIIAFACLIVAVGLACRGLVPAGTPQDAVLTAVLTTHMPAWMHVVVSFALISAIVSSADSCLVTAATVLSYDLLGRREPSSGQACVILLGLAGAGISLWGKGILGFLLMAYNIFACGVVAPVFTALVWKRHKRLDSRWTSAAVMTGGIFGLTAAISGENAFSYTGMAASCLLAVCGGLLGGRTTAAAKIG